MYNVFCNSFINLNRKEIICVAPLSILQLSQLGYILPYQYTKNVSYRVTIVHDVCIRRIVQDVVYLRREWLRYRTVIRLLFVIPNMFLRFCIPLIMLASVSNGPTIHCLYMIVFKHLVKGNWFLWLISISSILLVETVLNEINMLPYIYILVLI